MKDVEAKDRDLELRDEYDFSGGVRGKYVERFGGGCTVVVLEPDVAEVFPDAASVNETLRGLIAGGVAKPGSK